MTSIAGPSTSSCGACAVTSIPDFRSKMLSRCFRSISSRVPFSRPSSRTTSSPPATPSRARCRRCSTCSTTRPGPRRKTRNSKSFTIMFALRSATSAKPRHGNVSSSSCMTSSSRLLHPKPWINWVSSIRRSRWSISSSVQWVTFCTRSSGGRSPTRTSTSSTPLPVRVPSSRACFRAD